MYLIKTESSFDAAHFLYGYEGKCGNLHGHRFRVIAEVYSKSLKAEGNKRGIVCDFKDIKRDLNALCEEFDHCLIMEKDSLKPATMAALKEEGFSVRVCPFTPTAEHLARCFYEKMREKGYRVSRIEVYETPNNSAAYTEGMDGSS